MAGAASADQAPEPSGPARPARPADASVGTPTPPNATLISAAVTTLPLLGVLELHRRGHTITFWEMWYRRFGVYGFFAVPLLTVSIEKCIYDTIQAAQGIDPCVVREERRGEGFPSGGHALPSFSVLPVDDLFQAFR